MAVMVTDVMTIGNEVMAIAVTVAALTGRCG